MERRGARRLGQTGHSALRASYRPWEPRELSEPHRVPRRARHGLHFAFVDTHEDGRLFVGDYGGLPDLLFHSRTSTTTLKLHYVMSSQFPICVLTREPPLDASVFLIASVLPGRHLAHQ